MGEKSSNKGKLPSKIELLQQMWRQQTLCSDLFQRAELSKMSGDLDVANEWYEKLIDVSKEHLQTALLHNQHYENPIDMVTIVKPLLNAMSVLADLLQAKGNLKRAERLRDEALELSERYLDATGRANTERERG